MTTRKKILFEGQDVSLSSTMQKLQEKAETASNKLLDNYTKTGKKSKDLVELLKREIQNQERLAQLSAADKRYAAAEKYSRKIEEINRKEEEFNKKLSTQRLRPKEREEAENKGREGFDEQRNAASTLNRDATDKLKESLEEQKRTNQLLKEMVESDRIQWEQEVKDDRKLAENFVNRTDKGGTEGMTPEEKAKYHYQKALLAETGPQKSQGGPSVLRDILGAGLIRDMGSLLGQMPNASDAYDLIPALTRMGGAFSGAGVGAGVGAIAGLASLTPDAGGGALKGAALGGEMGQRGGEIAGSALARFFTERENLESSSLRAQAISGLDSYRFEGMGSFNRFGKSRSEGFETYSQMAGVSGSIYNDVGAMLGAETGYGIDSGALMQMTGSSRRTGGQFGNEIRNLLGTAEEKGIDRVLFNDLVKGQTQLINSIGSMTEKVDPKNMTALMLEMNSVGGGFSVKDPRSMGLIQSIDSGLKGGNDFNNAMDLSVLRKIKPGGSLLDLLEVKEQGLATEEGREFFKGLIGQYKEMTGSEDQAVLSLRQRFTDIPISDLRRLVKDSDIIGSMDTSDMNAEADVTEKGNVARRAIMRSEVTDAFAIGAIEGMSKINDQMAGLFEKALVKAMENMDIGDVVDAGIDKAKGLTNYITPDWINRLAPRQVQE